jgi:hypothetical protein
MPRLLKDMDLFRTNPTRPEPINLAIRHVINWREFEFRKHDPEDIARTVKHYMVSKLSAALMERLQPFIVESMTGDGMVYQMEVMLSDRGTYERWLPVENEAGRRQGKKEVLDALPYGMNPNERWE